MASVLDIVNGISTVVSQYGFDGALAEDGQPVEVGLKREEGNPITDSRVIDGFKVSFNGPILRINYSSEISLKDVHDRNRFEGEMEDTVGDVAVFLKREYKKVTGNSLNLTKEGEIQILVQNISRIRTWVQAHCDYKIGGLSEVLQVEEPTGEGVDDAIKKWLDMNANRRATGTGLFGNDRYSGAAKPENVTGKRDEEPRS